MQRILKQKVSITVFVIILLLWGGNYFFTAKADSFSTPEKSLYNMDENLLLIPAFKAEKGALFFFIKDHDKLGTAYISKGFFGWRPAAGNLLYNPIGDTKDYQKLNKYQVHDDFLVYGLIKDAKDYVIEVNGKKAEIINLNKVNPDKVKESGLEDMYIWYYRTSDGLEDGKIELFDQDTQKLIDTANLVLEK